jgi:hypothetical protein
MAKLYLQLADASVLHYQLAPWDLPWRATIGTTSALEATMPLTRVEPHRGQRIVAVPREP